MDLGVQRLEQCEAKFWRTRLGNLTGSVESPSWPRRPLSSLWSKRLSAFPSTYIGEPGQAAPSSGGWRGGGNHTC